VAMIKIGGGHALHSAGPSGYRLCSVMRQQAMIALWRLRLVMFRLEAPRRNGGLIPIEEPGHGVRNYPPRPHGGHR
jgi:hypothetical protein